MKNYRTTLVGIAGALMLWLPELQKALLSDQPVNWVNLGIGLAIVVLGYFAKDSNVTGGTVQQ